MNTSDSKRPFYGGAVIPGIFNGVYWLAETVPAPLGAISFNFSSPAKANIFISLGTDSVSTTLTMQAGAVTSGGSPVLFKNPNFNISGQPGVSVLGGVTIDTPGIEVWRHELIGQAGQGSASNETVGLGQFFVTKPGEVYTCTVINNDASTDYVVDLATVDI